VDVPGELVAIVNHLLPSILSSSCIPNKLSRTGSRQLMLFADFQDSHLVKAVSGLRLS
jgi:hypothetical protein